jgi:Tol biopolymer transport system component/DNA-binding winged helix-turn-helix (wHTH) protein
VKLVGILSATKQMQGDFRIGDGTVVPTLNQILRGGTAVRVELKVMRVLLRLAARRGEVARREELIQEVWPDTFVTDDVLKRCISDLRKALGDDRQEPRFIETIPKVGYRLLTAVEPLEPQGDDGRALAPVLHASTPQEIQEQSQSQAELSAAPVARRRHALTSAAILVAVGLLMVGVVAQLPRRELPAPKLVPLTSMIGLEFSPTLSPDAEQVAFVWNGGKGDHWSIYLKLVGSSDVRRLTSNESNDFLPRWSPDGRQVAFVRNTPGGAVLYAVSPVTGVERKLVELRTPHARRLSWFPGGQWLAASHGSGSESGIFLIPAEGGELRPFLSMKGRPWYGDVAISPDGRQLAYAACAEFLACDLELVTIDGGLNPSGSVRTLVRRPAGTIHEVCWSRDGRSVLYVTEPIAYADRLWRIRIDGSGAPEPVDIAGIGARNPTLAPARDRLVFSQGLSRVSIHTLDSTFASSAVLASSHWDISAEFSPDGQHLVFSSSRSGEAMEIWVARADGSNARQLTRGPGRWQGSPTWSPDGRRIAFDSQQDDGHWQIWAIDADGGAPRQITTDPGDHNTPGWSPDGQWIFFSSHDENGGLRRVSARGGPPERITTGPGTGRPVVSPDGKEILYGAEMRKPSRLLAVPTAGGQPREVLPCVEAYDTTSTAIYYQECGRGPERNVRAMDATTGHDRVVGRTRDVEGMPPAMLRLAVSPDGNTVLVHRGSRTMDLMLIDNFK